MIHRTSMRIAVVSLVAACVGCPGSLEDPSRFSDAAGPCPDVPMQVFAKVCSTSGCHSAVDKMLGLDLQSPDVASRLVGVHAMGGGGTSLLVDPSSPAMSVIYTKLTATPPFGVRMPFSEPPLDDATVSCVLQWITQEVGDGGAVNMSDATTDDGPASDDGPAPGDDAATEDAAPFDAGKVPDAKAPVKDASTPGMDASVRDAGPADAAGPTDAKGE